MPKIGPIELPERPLLLAPMEDVTDLPFRAMCRRFGADMVCTEFAASEAMVRGVKKTFEKLKIADAERPVGIQVYGHKLESLREAAVMAAGLRPDFVELNFGCPVKKIANKGAGAGLLRNIPLLLEMTRACAKSISLPLTVKTRLGWDGEDKPILALAEQIQDAGAAALTIHGRTRAQMYGGQADWELIGRVKENPRMKIPIIGNGDVDSGPKAEEMFRRYGVDGIMIGRAAIGSPWVFGTIKNYLEAGQEKQYALKEKVQFIKELTAQELELRGPGAIFGMRRHYALAFKGLYNFREMRVRLLQTDEPENVFECLDEIAERWG
jgi:nifR3 family TIM-barrel protein